MLTLNETLEAEKILEKRVLGKNLMQDIALAARYYYTQAKNENKKIKINEVIIKLQQLLADRYDDYDSFKWYNRIKKIVNKVKSIPLYDFDYIPITENELKTIVNIKNKKLEKLAFTCLVVAKYYNMRNPSNNDYVNIDYGTLFKLARVTATTYVQPLLLNDLKQLGLVQRCKRIDNPNFRVLFIDNNSHVIFKVDDLREIGYTYLNYKGEKFVCCTKCGVLMRKKSNNNKYCRDCRGYQPTLVKTVVCCDCGKKFTIKSNSRRIRCDDCHQRERNRINTNYRNLHKKD